MLPVLIITDGDASHCASQQSRREQRRQRDYRARVTSSVSVSQQGPACLPPCTAAAAAVVVPAVLWCLVVYWTHPPVQAAVALFDTVARQPLFSISMAVLPVGAAGLFVKWAERAMPVSCNTAASRCTVTHRSVAVCFICTMCFETPYWWLWFSAS